MCEDNRFVPAVVDEIAKRMDLRAEGIFRVPGSADAIEDSVAKLNAAEDAASLDFLGELAPADLSSLFSRWFSSLPEPVLTSQLASEFAQACDSTADEEAAQDGHRRKVRRLVRRLPQPNQSVLRYLLTLLSKVAEPASTPRGSTTRESAGTSGVSGAG